MESYKIHVPKNQPATLYNMKNRDKPHAIHNSHLGTRVELRPIWVYHIQMAYVTLSNFATRQYCRTTCSFFSRWYAHHRRIWKEKMSCPFLSFRYLFFSETCLLGGWFLVWTCIYIYIYIYLFIYICVYICTYMYIKAITRVFTLVNRYSSRAATSIGHQRAWSSPVFPDSSWEPRQPPLDG